MKYILKNNGLTIVLLTLFTFTLVGHFLKGHDVYNEERITEDQLPPVSKTEYLFSGHFLSSVSENMESEFLQMAIFVYLTRWLYQRGSAESKKMDDEKNPQELIEEQIEEEYMQKKRKAHPVSWRLYENSLTLTFIFLFVIFIFLHAYGTMENINIKNMTHNKELIKYWDVFLEAEFWFESFQNWQSEFFSIAAMVVFSIFLRQKHSAQSKKLIDSNLKTGT